MTKRWLVLIILVLIAILVISSLAVLSGNFSQTTNSPSSSTHSILWQEELSYFGTDFVVEEGKVFVRRWSAIWCFDAESGEFLWTNSATGQLEVIEEKVYLGTGYSRVMCLDANTGAVEYQFQAPEPDGDNEYRKKAVAEFVVADGVIVLKSHGTAAYNTSTGELFWRLPYNGDFERGNSTTLPDSDIICMFGTSRINPKNGSTLWKIGGQASDYLLFPEEEKVIFWNYRNNSATQEGPMILCVNTSSGEELWRFDIGEEVFEPIVSNDLLLFCAKDGYFYAFNLTDTTLKWKKYVDFLAFINYNNEFSSNQGRTYLSVALPIVDTQKQRIFWKMVGKNDLQYRCMGTIYSLDLLNGNITWNTPITNIPYPENTLDYNIALLDNALYVSVQNELRCYDASTGNLLWVQNLIANLLSPISTYDKLYIVAGDQLIAYG